MAAGGASSANDAELFRSEASALFAIISSIFVFMMQIGAWPPVVVCAFPLMILFFLLQASRCLRQASLHVGMCSTCSQRTFLTWL